MKKVKPTIGYWICIGSSIVVLIIIRLITGESLFPGISGGNAFFTVLVGFAVVVALSDEFKDDEYNDGDD